MERTFFLRRARPYPAYDAFCGEDPPLETQNCAKLKNTLESLVAQLQNEPKPVLCFVVSDEPTSTACDANPHASFYVSKPGRYHLCDSKGCLGSAARGPRSASFRCCRERRLPGASDHKAAPRCYLYQIR